MTHETIIKYFVELKINFKKLIYFKPYLHQDSSTDGRFPSEGLMAGLPEVKTLFGQSTQ